jgi:hypothetical protein
MTAFANIQFGYAYRFHPKLNPSLMIGLASNGQVSLQSSGTWTSTPVFGDGFPPLSCRLRTPQPGGGDPIYLDSSYGSQVSTAYPDNNPDPSTTKTTCWWFEYSDPSWRDNAKQKAPNGDGYVKIWAGNWNKVIYLKDNDSDANTYLYLEADSGGDNQQWWWERVD